MFPLIRPSARGEKREHAAVKPTTAPLRRKEMEGAARGFGVLMFASPQPEVSGLARAARMFSQSPDLPPRLRRLFCGGGVVAGGVVLSSKSTSNGSS